MKLLGHILCLCLALALAGAGHHGGSHTSGGGAGSHSGHGGHGRHALDADRCEGMEMDAVSVNEEGVPYFFKDDDLYKGFHGRAVLSNESFAELDEHHHLGHVDAAFRMHYEDNPTDHDHMFFFLDHKVFSYYKHELEEGYPKDISEVFPGVPDHLDAAVECPKSECDEDSVIFFKGDQILHYNVKTKAVEAKEFRSMPNCTSAFRFMEHYYCFHGHMFSKFDPKTGDVQAKYPKEARDYFMRCAKFGEESDHLERERCSRVHLDAITSDAAGNMYAFRGHHFIHKDAATDTLKADSIESAFREVHSEVDAVFSYENHLYMTKGDVLYVYRVGEPHTLLDGYPKSVREELGIEAPLDAAFHCRGSTVHIVKGQEMFDVDMSAAQRSAGNPRPLPLSRVDTAMCHDEGLKVVAGNHYYNFESPMIFSTAKSIPEQHKVSMDLFGCDH
ncbi:hemopexin [Cheilinus undulatus]|uniref:hemopexin n=1 Tax=Cheilinus undulatus TaxID=241271 RepID=UPI001BD47865|nr:hemopexin [Cheilinus undulatus]